ncbi:hypothetical protein PAN31108_03124 [Pandoraea anhela]|uniref:Uncharacterized protein n=1 Tax=Pandoraea anhela TaxID=2508295 RepID=A0A5E4W8H9_9BURK|nr:hypothetical protein PAN31108_03124 [Pandoraea anhela]
MRRTVLEIEMFEEGGQVGLHYQAGHPTDPVAIETFDQLIAILGHFRAGVSPPVHANPPNPQSPVFAILDPRWQISGDPMGGGAVLRIRHPGFGWLAFSIPLHELVKFAGGASQIAQSMADDALQHRHAN